MNLVRLIVLLIFCAGSGAWGQNFFQQPASIHLHSKAGFLIPHRSYMNHMVKGHAFAFELDYQIQTLGKLEWQRRYRLPQIGVAYNFYDFGNRKLLGTGHSLITYIQFHPIKRPNFQMNIRTGIGLGYLTKTFDRLENPKNLAVASALNANINVKLSFREKLGERFFLTQGIEMTHFSNASFKTPNLGLNVPMVSLGVGYRIFTPEVAIDTQYYEVPQKFSYSLLGQFGVKQRYPVGGTYYPVGGLRFYVQKMFDTKSGLGLGTDLIYNSSHRALDVGYIITPWKIFQIGIMAHYTLKIDRLEYQFGLGAYIKNSLNPNGWVYNRIALQYIWDNGLLANLALKTHYAKADYFELGIGYRW